MFFLGEFAGEAEKICPRSLLRRVLDRARRMGYEPWVGFEYETFVFSETLDSVREKHFHNLKPIAPDFFGYSVMRNCVWSEFYRALLETCERMDFPLEGLHEETGAGVIEAALSVDGGLGAADKAALFKTFTKVLAQKHGLMATFMAKWSKDWPGQSGHIHMSLKDTMGNPVFHDTTKPHGMSDVMRKLALPRTLWKAAQRLKASDVAREWFGADFVDHFAATREWEEREFRRHVSDWELARYFEII